MDTNNIREYQKHLQTKKKILEEAVKQLKKEFIGLDRVIDQIADTIKGWFYFSEMQDRPTIINLWGLTGIGKTSLVNRFMELIDIGGRYYRFDLGESSNANFNMQDKFRNIYENSNNNSFVLGFDEFQLARTIDEEGKEISKGASRAIWDLLDSGKFDLMDFASYYIGTLLKVMKKLDRALKKGVVVRNGLVVEKLDEYQKIFKSDDDDDDDDDDEKKTDSKEISVTFFPSNYIYMVYNLEVKKYLTTTEVEEFLATLDGEQTIEFLIELYKESMKPKTIDCTKCLIFILGNLDEVYSMTQNFNPDISADEFHKDSLRISITQVKNSLKTRFRSEQIARLGNNHIIYPSFNTSSFKKIIELELEKVRGKIFSKYNLELRFDESYKELVYNEGVYPTQGTRPLFTTIQQMVSARLGDILSVVFIEGYLSKYILFKTQNRLIEDDLQEIEIEFYDKDDVHIHTHRYNQQLVLGKLRKEKQDDQQAITAVHESGHATLSSILLKTIPSSIISVTADNNVQGFTLTRTEWNYVSKGEIINRLAVLMGGLEAERLVFGEDKITIGANQDLQNATRLAIHVVYACGFGKESLYYGNSTRDVINVIYDDQNSEINKEAQSLLIEARKLAYEVLNKQKSLLLKLSDHLSDKRVLDKKQIKEFVEEYAINFDINTIIEDADRIFYRDHLKQQLSDALKE